SFLVVQRNRLDHHSQWKEAITTYAEKNELDYEIIVCHQQDNWGFRCGALFNEGFKQSRGDIIVCSHVDQIPGEDAIFWDGKSDVFLPLCKQLFVNKDGSPRQVEDI